MKTKGSKAPPNDTQINSIGGCTNCLKPNNLCVCDAIKPIICKSKVLILQHPQEPDKLLGTAQISHLMIPNSTLKIGLSWPNFTRALGKEDDKNSWVVLYLGNSTIITDTDTGTDKNNIISNSLGSLVLVNKKGVALNDQSESLKKITGIIVLDGTWSQAKALWWRNPWITKLKRAIVTPTNRSLYGRYRKEPRYESLSTIESIGIALSNLENNELLFSSLIVPFKALLTKYKDNY